MEKATAIVQARMGSVRCPGKSMELLKGVPVLEVVLKRLARAKRISKVVLATTHLERDTVLAQTAEAAGVMVFRGDESDLVGRFLSAADQYADDEYIVRVAADNVFIDWDEIDRAIKTGISDGYDYVGFANDAYPDRISDFAGEFIRLAALRKVAEMTDDAHDREHVYPYFCNNPDIFRATRIQTDPWLYSTLKLDLDYPEDLELIKRISEVIDDPTSISAKDVVATANRLMGVTLS